MNRTQAKPSEVVEASVYRRYAAAANQQEAALCCPIEYAADFLSIATPSKRNRSQSVRSQSKR